MSRQAKVLAAKHRSLSSIPHGGICAEFCACAHIL